MRKTDPMLLALAFAAAVAVGTVAYVVNAVLDDGPLPQPVSWHADRARAQETLDLIGRGVRVTPPVPPPHR